MFIKFIIVVYGTLSGPNIARPSGIQRFDVFHINQLIVIIDLSLLSLAPLARRKVRLNDMINTSKKIIGAKTKLKSSGFSVNHQKVIKG